MIHVYMESSSKVTMADEMIGVTKAEPEDLSSLYDLEYRANEDDAWYSVYVVLDADARELNVNYLCSPEYKVVFSDGQFNTEAEVDELVGRFRPLSQQLQDNECGKLPIGTTVCAAHGTADDDLRFYDAVVEAVNHQEHSFASGEEECLCNFVLFWKHGRGRGTLTSANIASICISEPATQLDPRISAFAIMAKKKITSAESISARRKSCESKEEHLESSQNGSLEMESNATPRSLMSKDSGRIGNCNGWTSQDEDMGPKPCNIDGLATGDNRYFILISNLEKDLNPSSIEDFIYKQTTILPQACVFPRLLSDPFTRGAIMVGSQENVEKIYEFLENPNHLVVSSKGRPWVIMEKALAGRFGTNIWNLIPLGLDEFNLKGTEENNERTEEQLQVALPGTESYKRANHLKDIFLEFVRHHSRLSMNLVKKEEKILRSSPPAYVAFCG